eukprot:CAMPEP_0119279998 /NCGR_PEP_ID=MMETSP1329-20130426/21886_1 /TAXON_ID=114041 /ORGANISM="Genus nov. species nov., Strain RCC1024" /LENGTH=101 /DNA_ID=CAMNT_0007280569 /DNA_START=244 /DNA_END=546 /DNA_ORIENTATION=-
MSKTDPFTFAWFRRVCLAAAAAFLFSTSHVDLKAYVALAPGLRAFEHEDQLLALPSLARGAIVALCLWPVARLLELVLSLVRCLSCVEAPRRYSSLEFLYV